MASTRTRPAILDRIRPPVDAPDAAGKAAVAEAPAAPARSAPGWMVWMCLGIVYVVWGSTYLGIRVADETMPPLLTSGVRFLIAGAIVYAVLAVRKGSAAMRITRPQLVSCALIGTLLVAGGNGFVMVGEVHVPSGVAALIIASVPLWVVLYRRLGGERVARGTLAGVAAGFAAAAGTCDSCRYCSSASRRRAGRSGRTSPSAGRSRPIRSFRRRSR
jgi:hypothetical protein